VPGDLPPADRNPKLAIRDPEGVIYVGPGTHAIVAQAAAVPEYERGWLIDPLPVEES
jgi:hypothetical protein